MLNLVLIWVCELGSRNAVKATCDMLVLLFACHTQYFPTARRHKSYCTLRRQVYLYNMLLFKSKQIHYISSEHMIKNWIRISVSVIQLKQVSCVESMYAMHLKALLWFQHNKLYFWFLTTLKIGEMIGFVSQRWPPCCHPRLWRRDSMLNKHFLFVSSPQNDRDLLVFSLSGSQFPNTRCRLVAEKKMQMSEIVSTANVYSGVCVVCCL